MLELGMSLDRRIDLLLSHALLDVRIIGDRLQRDVLCPLTDESMSYVIR